MKVEIFSSETDLPNYFENLFIGMGKVISKKLLASSMSTSDWTKIIIIEIFSMLIITVF